MASPPTIEDFQLTREEYQPRFLPNNFFGFLTDFLGPTDALDGTWQFFQVYMTVDDAVDESDRLQTPSSGDSDGPQRQWLHSYAISVPRQTYVILNVKLVDKDDHTSRYTDMRLSEMIVANWNAAAGPVKLENLGVKLIINGDSRTAMVNEFAHATTQGTADADALHLPLTRDQALNWAANPFIKCADYVAGVVAGDSSKVRVWLLRDDTENNIFTYMDMFVELDYVEESDQNAGDSGDVTGDPIIDMNLDMTISGSTDLQIKFFRF